MVNRRTEKGTMEKIFSDPTKSEKNGELRRAKTGISAFMSHVHLPHRFSTSSKKSDKTNQMIISGSLGARLSVAANRASEGVGTVAVINEVTEQEEDVKESEYSDHVKPNQA